MSRIDDPSDPTESKIHADIARVGWSAIGVPEDDEGPAFEYSIGFLAMFQQPEVLIFGQRLEVMHGMLARIAESFGIGQQIDAGSTSDQILDGYICVFRAVPFEQYRNYLGYALWYYGGHNFAALQCVWPDLDGRYPWDADASQELRRREPVLS